MKLSHDIAAFTSTLEKSVMGSVKWPHVVRTSLFCLIQKCGGTGCQISILKSYLFYVQLGNIF